MFKSIFLFSINCSILKHFKELEGLNYGIIMDAGSSGTRMYIYEWKNDPDCKISPLIKPKYYRYGKKKGKQMKFKIKGGISEVKPDNIEAYLNLFINKALKYIPKNKYHKTPIYLKATAGMRLLDLDLANEVLKRIRESFSKTPFLFKKSYVQIIPGEYEGIFGWLSLNYLNNDHTIKLAALDLGGASTQITFHPSELPLENAFPINLNGTTKVTYTHSYLKYGRNQARIRYHNTNYNTKEDPCFIKGNKVKFEGNVKEGTGEFLKCLNLTNKLTVKNKCSFDTCGLNGIYQPPLIKNMLYYFTAGYYSTAKFFNCTGKTDLKCLFNNANELCSNSKEYLLRSKEYINELSKSYLVNDNNLYKTLKSETDQYCFNAAYVINLLNIGYGFSMDDVLYFSKSINGIDIGWTLGAMVYEANLLYPAGQCCK